MFLAHHLVDYAPDVLTPTWRNGRVGSDSISKRLDHFLISDRLISTEDRIRSWVNFPFLLDHAPIIPHLDSSPHKIVYPFKLNSGWLLEEYFNFIVVEVWKDPKYLYEPCVQHRLVWNLKSIKACIKSWAATYRQYNAQILLDLESYIQALILAEVSPGTTRDGWHVLNGLESERNRLLLKYENT